MKYVRTMWDMTEGYRKKYALSIFILFLSVLLYIFSTFFSKILIDCLTGDIYNPALAGDLEVFIASWFGGADYLTQNYWVFSIIIVGIGLGRFLTITARGILRTDVNTGIRQKVQLKLFYHIERLPYSFIKKAQSGDLLQTCTRDEDVLRRFLCQELFTIFYTLFIVLLAFGVLVSINWIIACSSIIILPVLFVYSFFMIKVVRKRYRLTDESEAKMTGKIEENISAVRVVKAYNNEKYEIDQFEDCITDYKHKFIEWRKASSFFFSSSDVFVFGQIALTTVIGIWLASTGAISAGTLAISFTFVSMIVWPVRDVATTLSNLARAMVSMDRLNKIFNEPLEDIDTGITPSITGNIEFDHTDFIYDDGSEPVLRDINFNVKAGETIAILGRTGSGKSTLAQLLTRLYEYTGGSIKIDGVELNTISKKYIRNNVAMVLQEPFLFSKTIYSNLKLANKDATNEQIMEAAKIADIHHNIEEFKQGYETPVGEKGVTLSGGQKQRLAMARTILKQAPILIFDDSLSAVDTETDINIRKQLKERRKNTTTLIITHRIATAKDADKVIVLENGTVSEFGTHDELIKKAGLYKRIYDIQSKME